MAGCVCTQFLAGPNLLTGNTDEHWRAVRKGVAPAFSAANMRCAPCLAWAAAWAVASACVDSTALLHGVVGTFSV